MVYLSFFRQSSTLILALAFQSPNYPRYFQQILNAIGKSDLFEEIELFVVRHVTPLYGSSSCTPPKMALVSTPEATVMKSLKELCKALSTMPLYKVCSL